MDLPQIQALTAQARQKVADYIASGDYDTAYVISLFDEKIVYMRIVWTDPSVNIKGKRLFSNVQCHQDWKNKEISRTEFLRLSVPPRKLIKEKLIQLSQETAHA